ncbi:MAG TPA: hypothetical protein VIX73_19210, partial [Kofleriaceae bacterium]
MRAGNVAAPSTKAGGCSCGGSCGGSSGGSCGCGCNSCQSTGQGFARPRFFAGQLLTEDDLDLLESYVVEKNRLHNRSFFGEGVVCGLMVTCDPCGGGRVTVQSGYALDCCGNDIVVPCAVSLDVNALVRRLRIERTGGIDCGDPCTEEKAKAQTKPAATTGTTTGTTPATGLATGVNIIHRTNETEAPPPLPPAEYCLYVRYCEQSTDPISPYATDDPCGAQACEPTRIREGYSFELRCRDCDEPTPDNLFSRISECLGDMQATERSSRNLRSALLYNNQMKPALTRISQPDVARHIVSADRIEAASLARIRLEALPKTPEAWTAENVYDAAESAQTLASIVAANDSLTDEDRKAMDATSTKALEDAVKSSQQALSKFQKTAPAEEKINTLITDPFDRDLTTHTLKQSLLWSSKQPVTGVSTAERDMLAAGIVYSPQIRTAISTNMGRVKAILLDRLGKRETVTDCALLGDLKAIQIPEDDPATGTSSASALAASDAVTQLLEVLVRYIRECICSAVNPPCPPCDDPAVLLACLRVEGCEVRDICNLERSFVLTSVAFRYWIPFLRSFGNIIERFCCPENSCDPPSRTDDYTKRRVATPITEIREAMPRSYMEKNSALNLADAYLAPGKRFDPNQLAAVMPARLAFSPDDARRLVTSTAAVLDIVGMRRGVAPGELLNLLGAAPQAPAVPAPAPVAAPAAP